MSGLREHCDLLVIGGGHAGCEAALAGARRGLEVMLVSPSLDRLGWLSCNPSVGGVGKGHLVRELDLLGGAMGRLADQVTIHARTINASKGPAVRATRVQVDMFAYSQAMAALLDATPGLLVRQGLVEQLCVEGERVRGARTVHGEEIRADAVVLTTGTFLRAVMHLGPVQTPGGRSGEPAATGLSANLAELGFPLGRLKTGTCPRLDARSLDLDALEAQLPELETRCFSVDTTARPLAQLPCHITYTTAETHALIRAAIDRAPLFSGQIEGTGPRYCPSIEDKVVRFAHRDRHQIFLEPEGLDSCEVYPSGLSTSLPTDVQLAVVRSLPGCAGAQVRRWGYAVEYDHVPPTELWPSLETKRLAGLFLAGQINGTSGYEEAAAQGLIAGVNAANQLQDRPPLVLQRDEAYLGVLIDDLVTRGTDEPYRMFTSRAEHRLLLREDNVVERLLPHSSAAGLRDAASLARLQATVAERHALAARCQREQLTPSAELDATLAGLGSAPLGQRQSWAQLIKRPELSPQALCSLLPGLVDEDPHRLFGVITDLRYAGYIAHAETERARTRTLEQQAIPTDLRYEELAGLSLELREKLGRVRPRTLGQAARIPGVTHAALQCVAVELLRRAAEQACA